jgi:hypothetical protein
VLRVLLAEEVAGRDAATRRMRRKTAAFPSCARSFKMRMTASFAVSMCGREYGPAGFRRRGLGVRGGVVVVSLT